MQISFDVTGLMYRGWGALRDWFCGRHLLINYVCLCKVAPPEAEAHVHSVVKAVQRHVIECAGFRGSEVFVYGSSGNGLGSSGSDIDLCLKTTEPAVGRKRRAAVIRKLGKHLRKLHNVKVCTHDSSSSSSPSSYQRTFFRGCVCDPPHTPSCLCRSSTLRGACNCAHTYIHTSCNLWHRCGAMVLQCFDALRHRVLF